MDSVNLETLREAVAWQAAGLPVTLATVVRTWGSSPRPEGALLAICGDGRLAGSVSGGCIEDDLGDRLRTQQLHHLGAKRHMGAAQDAEPNYIHILLQCRLGDHLRRLADAGVDHFKTGVAQRPRHHFGAAVVPIQPRLGH